jgi:serine phosphatase RsbU (regulator of sigma subunit)
MQKYTFQDLPLFAGLPPEEIASLASALRRCDYPAGELILREGEPGDRLLIVLEGQLEIIKALGTNDEHSFATRGAGDFLGEMSLLDPDGRRSASVRGLTPVQTLEMTRADFDGLINRQPALAIYLLRELVSRLRNVENATIRELQEKNSQLSRAYQELKAAQAQLIEKEKLERELEVARKIQESILPKQLPSLPGWQTAAFWRPARAVSGDFYDFIPFPDGQMGLVVGDVTGKGIPAAMVMAITRSVIHAVVVQARAPSLILAEVNDLLCQDMTPGMFVTCLFTVLDPVSGRLRLANAGHDMPFHRTSDGLLELQARGMPLGIFPGSIYEEIETTLSVGDGLLMCSDGLVEAHNPQGEMFDIHRLSEVLASQPFDAGIIDFLMKRLADFTGPAWEQEDDVTLVTLKRLV